MIQKFYNVCKNVSTNYKDFADFRERVDYGTLWLGESFHYFSQTNEKLLKVPLDHLTKAIEDSVDLVDRLKRRLDGSMTVKGTVINLILNVKDQDDIKSIRSSLDVAIDDLRKTVPAMEVFKKQNEKLKELLNPKLFDSEVKRFMEVVQKDSRSWLHDEIDIWMDGNLSVPNNDNNNSTEQSDKNGPITKKKNENLFWLQADGGMGKSAFSASLIDRYGKKEKLLAAFFLKFTDKTDAKILWKSLGYQIAMGLFLNNSPLLYTRILDFAEGIGSNSYSEEQLFRELILDPLVEYENSLSNINISKMILVIDALDEVGEVASRQKFLNIMSAQVQKLPKFIKLFVTSRPETDIITKLERYYNPTFIREDDVRHEQDLKAFIKFLMSQTVLRNDEKLLERAVGLLFNKSQSKFVYVSSVYENLKNYFNDEDIEGEEIVNKLGQFPEGLSESYKKYFDQIKANINHRLGEAFKLLLEILVSSREPMLFSDIQILLSDTVKKEDLIKLSYLLHTVFPLRGLPGNEKFVPYHKSIVDWLTDEDKSFDHYVDVRKGHRVLSERLLRQIKGYDQSGNNLLSMPHENGINSMYLYNHLLDHLDEADRQTDSLRLIFDFKWIETMLKFKNRSDFVSDLIIRSYSVYNKDSNNKKEEWNSINDRRNIKLILQFIKLVNNTFSQDKDIVLIRKELYFQLKCRFQNIVSSDRNDNSHIRTLLNLSEKYNISDHSWKIKNPALQTPGGSLDSILFGHRGSVNSVTVLSDGRIVSGSSDNTIMIWNIDTGECEKVLEGHTSSVSSLSVLSDGRVISGSHDKTIRVWNIDTGECEKVLEGHSSSARSVIVLSDGRIVSGSSDKTIRIWNIDTGECEKVLEGHSNYVHSVCVLSDGRIVSGSQDKTIRIWNIDTGECEKVLEGHTRSVWSVSVLSDGRIVSGSQDKANRIWNIDTGECENILEGHSDAIYSVSALSDGRVVSCSVDKTIRIWNIDTGECEKVLEGHRMEICLVSVMSDGRVVSGSVDNTIRIWNIDTGEDEKVLEGHRDYVFSLSLLSDGRVVSNSFDETIRIWNIDTWECEKVFEGYSGDANSVIVLSDGRVVSGSQDNTIRIWNIDTGECEKVLEGHTNYVCSVSLLSDGRIISSSMDKTIRIWNIDTGECEKVLEGHSGLVDSLKVISDGRVVSGSWDKTIRIWNIDTGECEKVLEGHSSNVWSMSVLSDGRVVGGFGDKTIRIWNIDTGECEKVLEGHRLSVCSVSVLADGRVISSSDDKTIRIWNIHTGECDQVILALNEDLKILLRNNNLQLKFFILDPPVYLDGLEITQAVYNESTNCWFVFLSNGRHCILEPPNFG